MNTLKEQNMTDSTSTDLIWDSLEVSGKAIVFNTFVNDIDISRLHNEARDYGVSLSIKHSNSIYHDRLYVYLRKNRG